MKNSKTSYTLGVLRIAMGWTFLWPFLDKLFGLGFATTKEKAWINGGSPTTGFLKAAVKGPFADMYHNLAGNGFVDWLFMVGLLCLGIALILGIGIKIAAYAGTLLVLLMFLSLLPPQNNPLIDEHIIYALVLIILACMDSGKVLGFGKQWAQTGLVRRFPFLT